MENFIQFAQQKIHEIIQQQEEQKHKYDRRLNDTPNVFISSYANGPKKQGLSDPVYCNNNSESLNSQKNLDIEKYCQDQIQQVQQKRIVTTTQGNNRVLTSMQEQFEVDLLSLSDTNHVVPQGDKTLHVNLNNDPLEQQFEKELKQAYQKYKKQEGLHYLQDVVNQQNSPDVEEGPGMIFHNDSTVRKDFQNDSSCLGSLPPSDDEVPAAQKSQKTDDILDDMPLLTVEQDSEQLSHDLNLDTHQSSNPRGSHLVVPGYVDQQLSNRLTYGNPLEIKNGIESLNNGEFEPIKKLFINNGFNFGQSDMHELNSQTGSNMVCLEDHRLMIDRAIDKLKYELTEKEKELIQPLAYRQKSLYEEHAENKQKFETRLEQLERMVIMQEQTIRCLLDVNLRQQKEKEMFDYENSPRKLYAQGDQEGHLITSPIKSRSKRPLQTVIENAKKKKRRTFKSRQKQVEELKLEYESKGGNNDVMSQSSKKESIGDINSAKRENSSDPSEIDQSEFDEKISLPNGSIQGTKLTENGQAGFGAFDKISQQSKLSAPDQAIQNRINQRKSFQSGNQNKKISFQTQSDFSHRRGTLSQVINKKYDKTPRVNVQYDQLQDFMNKFRSLKLDDEKALPILKNYQRSFFGDENHNKESLFQHARQNNYKSNEYKY